MTPKHFCVFTFPLFIYMHANTLRYITIGGEGAGAYIYIYFNIFRCTSCVTTYHRVGDTYIVSLDTLTSPPPFTFRYAGGDMRASPSGEGGGKTHIYSHILIYFVKLHRYFNILLFRGSIYDP